MINQDIEDSQAYNTYLDFATGKATPKKAKNKLKLQRRLKPTKKYSTVQTTGVVIKDTPGVFVSKKKAPAKVDRGKGMDLLSDVASLEAAQLKQTFKKSKQETHMLHVSSSGDEVGYQRDSGDEDRNDDDSDDANNDDDDIDSDADGDNDASDSERTDSDEDENPTLNLKDDEEEEYEEELKDAEHEEEGKGDAKMTDVGRDDVSQEKSYEQVKDDM
ncbi:hypothetical protein Tco_0033539, partial [Tanacetum coccineum]